MIRKFQKINCASYVNFDWNNNEELKKINIFYGHNGSGKTTLSRILRSFEIKKLYEKYDNQEFELLLDDNVALSQSDIENNNLNVRVYNKDFINDNLKFLIDDSNGDIKAFKSSVIGRDNTEIEMQIQALKLKLGNEEDKDKNIEYSGLFRELFDLEEQKKNFEANKAIKETDLNTNLINKAREIKQDSILMNVNYNKSNLEKDINDIISNYNIYMLNEDEERTNREILAEQEKNIINFNKNLVFGKDKFDNIYNEAKNILEKEIKQAQNLEANVRQWLEQGIKLHSSSEKCIFCENILNHERWQWLIDNIQNANVEERRELEQSINMLLEECDSAKLNIENILNFNIRAFYTTNENEFLQYESNLKALIQEYNNNLNIIKNDLMQKQSNIFEKITLNSLICDKSSNIKTILENLETLCNNNNNITENLTTSKEEARKKIKLHIVAKFIEEKEYKEKKEELNLLQENINSTGIDIQNKKNEIEEINNKITNLEDKKSDEREAANNANELLNSYFGNKNLKFNPINEKEFEVLRNGEKAINLSEGECSLVAFCYFMAKLKNDLQNNSDLIIWIDDPISSLDTNYIFYTFAIINDELFNDENLNFQQFFISTHNLDFLKYLKRLKTGSNNQRAYFLVEKSVDSRITNMPKYLKEHITEFNYLFKTIHDHCKISDEYLNDNDRLATIYNFGNNLRKFLELYLYFKYPDVVDDNKELSIKIPRFFGKNKNSIVTERYANEYSHLLGVFERGMREVDIPESKKIAQFVLDTIKEKDKEQYNALLKSIGVSNDLQNS
ncbi:AAA family ATPase [Campylobacter sp. JMF_08 NE1]|uniref:AAA family ATPase n=1 Tax=Campylobacter sp. JMF_08 NE1 TaxID=2983821 RepID=UPI0022EA0C48|nr:AAA family ATPase [Campylobacter sp. JMF_08 NE1]MDA3047860.1 AAA family ATPase [Campylobacter sp. JMF_08 NE1]